MQVKDGMSPVVLSVGPAHTLRQAARMMASQQVGAAVVLDAERSGIGILTERDILNSMGADQDPDTELVSEHRTNDVAILAPEVVSLPSGSVRRFLGEVRRGNVQAKFPRVVDEQQKRVLRGYAREGTN